MKDRQIIFKKAIMDGKEFKGYEECKGYVLREYEAPKEINKQVVMELYFMVLDEDRNIHHIKPWQVVKFIGDL